MNEVEVDIIKKVMLCKEMNHRMGTPLYKLMRKPTKLPPPHPERIQHLDMISFERGTPEKAKEGNQGLASWFNLEAL